MSNRFDRDREAYGYVSHHADFDLADFSIVVTFRIDRPLVSGETHVLVSKGSFESSATNDATFYVALQGSSAQPIIRCGFRDAVTGVEEYNDTARIDFPVGRWVTLATTYDDTTKALNVTSALREGPGVDGEPTFVVEGGATATGATPTANTAAVRIGAGEDATASLEYVADVSICDVQIFSAVITPTLARLAGNEASLVAYWRGDEGETGGQVLYSRSGNGHNVTLANRVLWSDWPTDLYYPAGWTAPAEGFIGRTNWLRGPSATITASQEATGYEASALRAALQAIPWRSSTTGTKTLTVDFGRPVPLIGITADGLNLGSSSTTTIALHTADSWGSPDVSEHVTYHPRMIRHLFTGGVQQYRYMRLELIDSAPLDSATYLEVGSLGAWAAWEDHSVPDLAGQRRGILDPSTAVETAHGRRTVDAREVGRGMALSWSQVRRSHALELRRVVHEIGGGQPVWLCPDPSRELYRSVVGTASELPGESMAGPSWCREAMGPLAVEGDRA